MSYNEKKSLFGLQKLIVLFVKDVQAYTLFAHVCSSRTNMGIHSVEGRTTFKYCTAC